MFVQFFIIRAQAPWCKDPLGIAPFIIIILQYKWHFWGPL